MRGIPVENPFLSELQKIAIYHGDLEAEANSSKDPMNPEVGPKMSQEAASEEQNKDEETKEAELQEAKDNIEREKEASEYDLLADKIAAALPEFGVIARLYDWAQGGDTVSEQVYKEASAILDDMLTSEDKYVENMTRVATELFASKENQEELYSEAGMEFVFKKIADFIGNEDLQKEAAASDFMHHVLGSMGDFVNSMGKFLKDTKELAVNKAKLEAENIVHSNTLNELGRETDPTTGAHSPRGIHLLDQLEASPRGELVDSVRNGQIGRGLAGAGLAAGALYGGHKLYQGLHAGPGEEQVASSESKGLLSKVAGGTLMEEYRSETGGMAKMNRKSIVPDFLKIAGAAALIQIAQDETADAGFRKEASDTFDEISFLGRSEMGAAFIKIAQEAYTEQELHEIVAGKHTANLLNKVAFFLQVDEMCVDELNKVAGAAAGVATKGVGGALSDAASNIEAYVDTAKENAEGAGRQYIGVVKGAEGKGENKGPAGTGLAGGQLTGSMAGYNVVNNPAEYDVEQTAAMVEEAVLAKQAAVETFNRADAFLNKYARIVASK
jgi:hypothetical protein